jgi:uncharacterized protein
MPRPCKRRRISCHPVAAGFGPDGVADRDIESVSLAYDEIEALRLADFEGMYQEEAARKMNVSRSTFGNIVTTARKKVADFIVNSKRLSVEGGAIEHSPCRFVCSECSRTFSVSAETQSPSQCPHCKSRKFCCENTMRNKTKPKTCWRTA